MKLGLGLLIVAAIVVMMLARCFFRLKKQQNASAGTKSLCPTCMTGLAMYQLDQNDGMCPYLNSYAGNQCAYYQSVSEIDGELI